MRLSWIQTHLYDSIRTIWFIYLILLSHHNRTPFKLSTNLNSHVWDVNSFCDN